MGGLFRSEISKLDNLYARPKINRAYAIFSVKGKAYSELEETRNDIIKSNELFYAFSKKKRIEKEAVDASFKNAIRIWEKHITNNPEIDEKAIKGLRLNCALGYAWLNDLEKSAYHLNQVPEALNFTDHMEESEEEEFSNLTVNILDFASYARNTKLFCDDFSKGGLERITFLRF